MHVILLLIFLGLEDGLIDGVPVWGMIYYCLRSGDISAAFQAATQAGQGLAEMVKFLGEIRFDL
jgi:nuclear pore complex protein Nup93